MSPNWSDRPPAPTEFAGLRLIRVAAGSRAAGICLSQNLIGCYTHYTRRRTIPCEGAGCQFCEDSGPPRWHGYVALQSLANKTVAVLELTALAAVPLADYLDRQGTLRGARIDATRTGSRANAPVTATVQPADIDLRQLPREPNVRRFLEILWDVKPSTQARELAPPLGQNIRNITGPNGAGQSRQPAQDDHHEEHAP